MKSLSYRHIQLGGNSLHDVQMMKSQNEKWKVKSRRFGLTGTWTTCKTPENNQNHSYAASWCKVWAPPANKSLFFVHFTEWMNGIYVKFMEMRPLSPYGLGFLGNMTLRYKKNQSNQNAFIFASYILIKQNVSGWNWHEDNIFIFIVVIKVN